MKIMCRMTADNIHRNKNKQSYLDQELFLQTFSDINLDIPEEHSLPYGADTAIQLSMDLYWW